MLVVVLSAEIYQWTVVGCPTVASPFVGKHFAAIVFVPVAVHELIVAVSCFPSVPLPSCQWCIVACSGTALVVVAMLLLVVPESAVVCIISRCCWSIWVMNRSMTSFRWLAVSAILSSLSVCWETTPNTSTALSPVLRRFLAGCCGVGDGVGVGDGDGDGVDAGDGVSSVADILLGPGCGSWRTWPVVPVEVEDWGHYDWKLYVLLIWIIFWLTLLAWADQMSFNVLLLKCPYYIYRGIYGGPCIFIKELSMFVKLYNCNIQHTNTNRLNRLYITICITF